MRGPHPLRVPQPGLVLFCLLSLVLLGSSPAFGAERQVVSAPGASEMRPAISLGAGIAPHLGVFREPLLVTEEERARRRMLLKRLTTSWLTVGIAGTSTSLAVLLGLVIANNSFNWAFREQDPPVVASFTVMTIFATGTLTALVALAFQSSEGQRYRRERESPSGPAADLSCGCLRF